MIGEIGYNIYENTMCYPHAFYESEAILKNPSYLQRIAIGSLYENNY